MDKPTKTFLKSLGIPEYCANLLELYGILSMKDISEQMIESETTSMVQEIEDWVRSTDGGCSSMVDLNSKDIRLTYLGHNFTTVSNFRFKPIDSKKLKSLKQAADSKLNIR